MLTKLGNSDRSSPNSRDTRAPPSGAARGYQWIHWTRGGMSFWAVSDAAAADLAEFARLLRR